MHEFSNIDYFADIAFAGTHLLLPQSDIYSLEPSVDMTVLNEQHSVGQLPQQGILWSLYALSAELDVLTKNPSAYHIAVLLKNTMPASGVLCEQISTITSHELNIQPVPTAMYQQNSPILALAIYGEQLRYISTAAALSHFFLG